MGQQRRVGGGHKILRIAAVIYYSRIDMTRVWTS